MRILRSIERLRPETQFRAYALAYQFVPHWMRFVVRDVRSGLQVE